MTRAFVLPLRVAGRDAMHRWRLRALCASALSSLVAFESPAAAESVPLPPAAAAAAQNSAASAETAQAMIIVGKRPLQFPYRRGYAAAKKVSESTGDRVALVVTLAEDSTPVAAALRLTLEYDDTVLDVPLDASRSFVFPIDDEAERRDGKLVVNRRSGSLGVRVDIRPRIAERSLTVARMSEYVVAGRKARAALLPWYARLVTPTVNSLRICSVSAQARFVLRSSTGRESEMDTVAAVDTFGRAARCADFFASADERQKGAADDLVVLPDDATFDYMGSLF